MKKSTRGESMKNLKLSFVLPVYNCQSTVYAAIESLLNQNYDNKEIIVINDSSTDNTDRIVKLFGNKIRYISRNKPRSGAAVCRNVGNELATGQIVVVCDVDLYYPERAEAIAEFFKKNKDKDVFSSTLHCQDSRKQYQPWEQSAFEWDFKSKCPISHPTVAYRATVSKDCPYHEDSIDTDLYEFMLLDAHNKGYKFGGCQDPLMMKIEGNSLRDVSGAKELKAKKYKEYGIEI